MRWPLALRASSCLRGPTLPGSSGVMPGRAFLSMASAWSGMSGRLQASGAGDRSSVLVSPVTLKTVRVRFWGTSGRLVNHSASAQDFSTALACALPASALAFTSAKASKTSRVFFSPSAAMAPTWASSSRSMRGFTLKPPSMVPSSSVAFSRDTRATFSVPLATLARKAAFTRAASSTPAGTRWIRSSTRAFSSPAGGWARRVTSSEVCASVSGRGGMPRAARSATCWR